MVNNCGHGELSGEEGLKSKGQKDQVKDCAFSDSGLGGPGLGSKVIDKGRCLYH